MAMQTIEVLFEHELKDIPRPQRLFQVEVDGPPSDFPPPKSLDGARVHAPVVTLLSGRLPGTFDRVSRHRRSRALQAAVYRCDRGLQHLCRLSRGKGEHVPQHKRGALARWQ